MLNSYNNFPSFPLQLFFIYFFFFLADFLDFNSKFKFKIFHFSIRNFIYFPNFPDIVFLFFPNIWFQGAKLSLDMNAKSAI